MISILFATKKISMYKEKIILIFLAFFSLSAFPQSSDTSIQFKGGFSKLNRFFQGMPLDGSRSGKKEDYYINYNRYFDVLMKLETNGSIDSIFVISIMDSIRAPFIIEVLKTTQGNWINNSGVAQMVVLPIYIIYKNLNEKEPVEKMLYFNQGFYTNWTKNKLIYLNPIIITSYSAQH